MPNNEGHEKVRPASRVGPAGHIIFGYPETVRDAVIGVDDSLQTVLSGAKVRSEFRASSTVWDVRVRNVLDRLPLASTYCV